MPKTSLVKEILSKKMFLLFLLGFSSGLPLLMTGGTLKTWLAREHVDISTIGYFGWVGMAYSLKFLWSPFLDRFSFFNLGRRRFWMMGSQLAIMLFLVVLGSLEPQSSLSLMAGLSVLIAFFSATQDIAVDAYRREVLANEELGLGASLGIYGYRVAMLISGGVGIGLVNTESWGLSWSELYYLVAALMVVGFVTTFMAPEPSFSKEDAPRSLRAAVVEPLRDFLKRDGAIMVLLFVFLFKLGDALGGAMLSPFYVEMGYSNVDIGFIAKTVGLASSLIGLLIGGSVIYYFGIYRSLWIFGVLQALSTAAFSIITFTGPVNWALALTVVFEDVSSGMGSAAFVAFIGSVCNRRYTATQYAILSSIATLGRNFFSGFSGDLVKAFGWMNFFILCGFIAIPGLLMLLRMRKHSESTD